MADEIRPALMPDEWKNFRDSRNEAAFAIMGLANASLPDDDPRKITREDVDLLLAAANKMEADMDRWNLLETERPPALRTLAAKLAALLPPA